MDGTDKTNLQQPRKIQETQRYTQETPKTTSSQETDRAYSNKKTTAPGVRMGQLSK